MQTLPTCEVHEPVVLAQVILGLGQEGVVAPITAHAQMYKCVHRHEAEGKKVSTSADMLYFTLHAPPNKEWEAQSGANERRIG
jgi:hypothetical protein